MNSLWNDGVEIKTFPSLEGTVKTDVLIIGGGISGLLCAYMLKNAGVDCIVAEADRICRGVTSCTTAKTTIQHGLIYRKITDKYGLEFAKLYYKSQNEALKKICGIAEEISCDFTEADSFVYSMDSIGVIEKEVETLNKVGCNAEFTRKTELPFKVAGAVKIENQGHFHPLKFAMKISKDLNIYENTKVIEMRPDGVITNKGKIIPGNIIVATHFPFINKHGGYFLKMYQHRSYVLALKNAQIINGMYVDEANEGLSFRQQKDILLLGGGGHRTGKNGGGWNELTNFAKKNYNGFSEVSRWATQDCITLDGLPYIGKYSPNTPGLYVATGFNKWGMTSSVVAATLLTDLICGKKNEYERLYSPQRSVWHSQLALNILEAAKGLLTPSVHRCPHLGCALKYNKEEHTWDCSCHGSRFEKDGKLINNPATDDKKV